MTPEAVIFLVLAALGAEWIAQLHRLFGGDPPSGESYIAEDDPRPYRVAMLSARYPMWMAAADTAPEAVAALKEVAEAFTVAQWELNWEGDLAVDMCCSIPNGAIFSRLEVVYMPELEVGKHLPAFVQRQQADTVRNAC